MEITIFCGIQKLNCKTLYCPCKSHETCYNCAVTSLIDQLILTSHHSMQENHSVHYFFDTFQQPLAKRIQHLVPYPHPYDLPISQTLVQFNHRKTHLASKRNNTESLPGLLIPLCCHYSPLAASTMSDVTYPCQ